MTEFKAGERLCSAVCSSEVVIIAAPATDIVISCGGAVMLTADQSAADGVVLDAGAAQGTQLGKRYTDAAGSLELLCVKPGDGSLAVDGEALTIKGAKPLPSSD